MDYKTVLAKLHSLANREDESYNMMIMHIRCIPEYRNWFASVVETEKAMRKYQTLMDQAPQVIANNDYEKAQPCLVCNDIHRSRKTNFTAGRKVEQAILDL